MFCRRKFCLRNELRTNLSRVDARTAPFLEPRCV